MLQAKRQSTRTLKGRSDCISLGDLDGMDRVRTNAPAASAAARDSRGMV